MERYALRVLQPAFPAPPGLRAIVVRDEPAGDGTAQIVHETLPVLGLQPEVIHHYTSDDPRPVHPDPSLMERHGWHYKHHESRYAPICLTVDGRLDALSPDDPRWILIPPDTPGDRVEFLARKLKDEERLRRTLERRIEDQEQGSIEGD